MTLTIELPDEAATLQFGTSLAKSISGQGGVILLEGDLGAGKTTLVRATLHALGYSGRVVSPSYTLVEPYNAGPVRIFHLDLYRLSDPEELEFIGIRDIDPVCDLMFVEWPSHGKGMLPAEDLTICLQDRDPGRVLVANGYTEKGLLWLQRLRHNHASVG